MLVLDVGQWACVGVGPQVLCNTPPTDLLEASAWAEGVLAWLRLEAVGSGVSSAQEEAVASRPAVDFDEVATQGGDV